MSRAKLYKIVGPNGEALHGGSGCWHMPTRGRPGKWMPAVADVRACHSGYHLVTAAGLLGWLPRNDGLLCEAEGRGARDSDDGKKTAFAQARIVRVIGPLNERTMRLSAADFAERVLPLFEKERPNDDRPRNAIIAARQFARGEIDAAAGPPLGPPLGTPLGPPLGTPLGTPKKNGKPGA